MLIQQNRVGSLSIILPHIEIILFDGELHNKQESEPKEIANGCKNVLKKLKHILDENSKLKAGHGSVSLPTYLLQKSSSTQEVSSRWFSQVHTRRNATINPWAMSSQEDYFQWMQCPPSNHRYSWKYYLKASTEPKQLCRLLNRPVRSCPQKEWY